MPREKPAFAAAQQFGARVRQLRRAQGWSQETLAERAGLHWTYVGSVERGERNQARAVLNDYLACREASDADRDRARALEPRTNQRGGAVAIGHPLGASGARITMSLVQTLRRRGGGIGAAAICGGFGQGDALLMKVGE